MKVTPGDGRGATKVVAPEEHFEGTTRIESIPLQAISSELWLFRQHSEAGARSAWHAHRGGQVLLVVDGEGRVQVRGGDVITVRAGDVVEIGPNEWHWHGAGENTEMTHVAYQTGGPHSIMWGDKVR